MANHAMRVPPSKYISRLQVSSGFDIADNEIVKRIEPNDLVITGDIPLAAEVIEKDEQRKTALSEKQAKLQIHLKTIEQALC